MQALGADQLEHRIADLDVVAGGDNLHLDLAVDRCQHPRLAHAAASLLSARPRPGDALAQGIALRHGVVSRVLGNEALRHQLLLSLGEALGLGQQRLQARDLGTIGARLDLEILSVDFGQQFAPGNLFAGEGEHAHHAPGDFGAQTWIDHVLQRADHVFNNLKVSRLHHDGAHQCRRRPGGAFRRLGLAAAARDKRRCHR